MKIIEFRNKNHWLFQEKGDKCVRSNKPYICIESKKILWFYKIVLVPTIFEETEF